MSESKIIEQMKQDFQFMLSKVSHEIRNPVTLINSYLQFIEKAHPEVAGYEYWDDILDQMDFLKKLLDELSIYNNSGKLHREPVHICAYLEKLTRELAPACEYLGIRLSCDNSALDRDVLLSLDILKIQQALFNLIRNAGESIENKGAIRILTARESNALCIRIEDDGCGIEPEYLPTLFEPFVTHKKSGTGMGLAIVKQIMQSHGGRVQVDSRPGRGTAFILSFPLESAFGDRE